MKTPALTTQEMVEVDRLMIEDYGITLIQMMENAGRNLAELAIRLNKGTVVGKSIAIVCGNGNNGGGGMVAARHLHNRGADVRLLRVDEKPLTGVPAKQWAILEKMGLRNAPHFNLLSADFIIDALIGYGLTDSPRGNATMLINRMNAAEKPILALDTPSGLDTTSGTASKPCVRAHATMTLALPKTGLLSPSAAEVVGELYLADISVPSELYKHLDLIVESPFLEDTIVRI